jgi:hypothetical protein
MDAPKMGAPKMDAPKMDAPKTGPGFIKKNISKANPKMLAGVGLPLTAAGIGYGIFSKDEDNIQLTPSEAEHASIGGVEPENTILLGAGALGAGILGKNFYNRFIK